MVDRERRLEILKQLDAILDFRQPLIRQIEMTRDRLEEQDRQRVIIRDLIADEELENIINNGDDKCAELGHRIEELLKKGKLNRNEEKDLKQCQEVYDYTRSDTDFFHRSRLQLLDQAKYWKNEIKATRRDYVNVIKDYMDRIPEQNQMVSRLLKEINDPEVSKRFKRHYLDMIKSLCRRPKVESNKNVEVTDDDDSHALALETAKALFEE